MAILNVSYNEDDQTVLLQPLNATLPAGYELIGTTGTGVTYYNAVKELLTYRGVKQMANITIKFDDLSATLATLKEIEALKNKPKPEPEEKTTSVDATEVDYSSGIFK